MERSLDRTGRRQRGLLTTPQLLRAGWSTDVIHDAVEAQDLLVVRRRVFRVAGAPFDRETAFLAAVLGAQAGTVLGDLSSTELFEFKWFPRADDIQLLTTCTPPRMPGVRGHHTISLPDYDVTHFRSIPTITAERAFIDTCGRVSAKTLGESGDDLLRRKVMRLPRLVKSFELIPASGRRKRLPPRLLCRTLPHRQVSAKKGPRA